ncbi:MAG: hypothetical protein QOF67_1326 [Mycobacterium sp.]|nr:hypothetical protein [Mycobacterium sp.]
MFTTGNCNHFPRNGITCLLVVYASECCWVLWVRSPARGTR